MTEETNLQQSIADLQQNSELLGEDVVNEIPSDPLVPEIVFHSNIAIPLVRDELQQTNFFDISNELSFDERKQTIYKHLSDFRHLEDVMGLAQAELLYEVKNNSYWKDWKHKEGPDQFRDYQSFDDFCRSFFDFGDRKIRYFLDIYETFAIKLGVPATKLAELHWTKVREVLPVVNQTNVDLILDEIPKLTVLQTKEFAKTFKQVVKGKEKEQDREKAESQVKATVTSVLADDQRHEEVLTKPTDMKDWIYKLSEEQLDTVKMAHTLCEKVSGYKMKSLQFDYICSTFLALQTADSPQQARLIGLEHVKQSIERTYGVQLEVVNTLDTRYDEAVEQTAD